MGVVVVVVVCLSHAACSTPLSLPLSFSPGDLLFLMSSAQVITFNVYFYRKLDEKVSGKVRPGPTKSMVQALQVRQSDLFANSI